MTHRTIVCNGQPLDSIVDILATGVVDDDSGPGVEWTVRDATSSYMNTTMFSSFNLRVTNIRLRIQI